MPSFDPSQCNLDFHGFIGHLFTHVIPFSFKFNLAVLFYYSLDFFKIPFRNYSLKFFIGQRLCTLRIDIWICLRICQRVRVDIVSSTHLLYFFNTFLCV
uniref:Uncharacterized protein n=1 Tax=Uncultured archaeon GZfos26G2 TaxID=3386331 RepID=Q64AC9_UNCAG|nr:hypothetical protein GZ32E7_9 [uncultured archaeon GZfos32E7]